MALVTPRSGDIVSFQLVANGLIGDERTEVKVSGVGIDYQTALMIDQQIGIKHVALFPYFTEQVGGINDPSAYEYVTFIGRNGIPEAIGIPWIQYSTYKILDGRQATVQITNFREDFRAPLITFLANLGATYTLVTKDGK